MVAEHSRILTPALHRYSGHIPRPERWATYKPRQGDIVVCTPSKSGTTWTQTILAMLLHGGADLPMKLPILSPWVDADLGNPASEVAAALAAQTNRRVIKTHTPLDGFPAWEGVIVINVYRHPLDVYFSLRKHYANMTLASENDPMLAPLPDSIHAFLTTAMDRENYSGKTLDSVVYHFRTSLQTDRSPPPAMLHYTDMIADRRATVIRLAEIAQIEADDHLIDTVNEATSFTAMKTRASDYAPGGGDGFFRSDADFFDSAQSQKWDGQLSSEELDLFEARLVETLPDRAARDWLCFGNRGTAAR
ncbi:MAG: sulfotransferase domain-containing protein [Pseudomonadota bacterium]